jgi:hypothetical protein
MAEAESVVRNYLLARNDPSTLIDSDRVANIEKSVRDTSDPVERLKLQAELRQASEPDLSSIETEFVIVVKRWAEEHGVTADLLEAEGVPRDVLKQAGLVTSRGGRKKTTSNAPRKPRVGRDEVSAHVKKLRGRFTLADVAHATDASTATVRKVVNEMVDEGAIDNHGPDEGYEGPGRAPTIYQKSNAKK